MPAIDLVQWPEVHSKDTELRPLYAWRFPEDNLSTYSQLIVRESQEAVLFSKGKLIGKFSAGKHTLDTENLPGLRKFFGIPFGGRGKNPFTAEVWFVNKVLPLDIDWVCDAMPYHDPDYQTMVPLAAAGKYGLRVDDAERFLIQLVGTASSFTARQLTEHFKGELVSKTKTAILQYMLAHRIGLKTVNACLTAISEALEAAMTPFWAKFGFGLAGFYITAINIDTQTDTGKRIDEAISLQSKQVITGSTYQQARMFDIAEQAARSGGGGLLGAVMMSSMLGGAAGIAQPMTAVLSGVQTPTASGTHPAAPPLKTVYCSNCAGKYSSDVKFCPHCGDPYMPCPRCAADNGLSARRCVSCGNALGVMVAIGPSCSRCQTALAGNPDFCPNCGLRVEPR
jgi:membrane protease subunit (stomatin/prohibitin family)